MPTLTLPGPGRTLERYTTQPPRPVPPGRPPFSRLLLAAPHVVADPLADRPTIDWDATIDFRLHLWSLGLGVAEATATAGREAGLDWPASLELIRRTVAAAPPGAALFCGAGTDHLPPGAALPQVAGAYQAQCESIEKLGGRVLLLPSAALAATARRPDDLVAVYSRVLSGLGTPALLHWPEDAPDPALLAILTAGSARVDGVVLAGSDVAREVALRRHLPRGVRLYTGNETAFPEPIAGDDDGYSHGCLAVLGAIAPLAAAALAALGRDDPATFLDTLAPTLPLARHLLRPPAPLARTGLVFLAYLNGHQSHFHMLAGAHAARSLPYLADLFRLADAAGLLRDPDDAAARMTRVLAVGGIVPA